MRVTFPPRRAATAAAVSPVSPPADDGDVAPRIVVHASLTPSDG